MRKTAAKHLLAATCATLCLLASVPDAAAGSWALLVGSNRPGPGQEELRYAQADAERVGAVLQELGDYLPERTVLLRDPSRGELEQAFARLRTEVSAAQAAGEPASVLFYYSGHARARSLNLGDEELPLSWLDEEVRTLPAPLRLVVLDACQSGALAGVKGAEPAADFSHNSVAALATQGLVVLASSAGSELSQESPELQGSFFTHHLVAGLRGAADQDRDGRVTLAEAHRYAYHSTLAATARTAVGAQHVSLQMELRGKGEMVLTEPAGARAGLRLPAALEAELLVQRRADGLVMAELHKAAGEALDLALPAGPYEAVLRRGAGVELCPVELSAQQRTGLALERCEPAPELASASKGAAAPLEQPWSLDLGLGLGAAVDDAYTERLEDFGFGEGLGIFGNPQPLWDLGLARRLTRDLDLVLSLGRVEGRSFDRSIELGQDAGWREQHFSWTTWRSSLSLRASHGLAGSWLRGYAQAGVGLGLARSVFAEEESEDDVQYDLGPVAEAAGGLQFLPWRRVGFFVQAGWRWAPVLQNLTDDEHDSGGPVLSTGLRLAY